MKKLFIILAVAAFGMQLNAQHVAPLTIQLADFALDTMRTKYANDPAMYQTELQRIVLMQEAETKAIKDAWKELKDEKQHAKDLASCLKEVGSAVSSLEKSGSKEEAAIKGMLKTIEKQMKQNSRTSSTLNAETRDDYHDYLTAEKRYLESMLDEIAARKKNLSDAMTGARDLQNGLNAFNVEIQQKELDLKQLENTSKTRIATIKNEQKIVKAMLKNK